MRNKYDLAKVELGINATSNLDIEVGSKTYTGDPSYFAVLLVLPVGRNLRKKGKTAITRAYIVKII